MRERKRATKWVTILRPGWLSVIALLILVSVSLLGTAGRTGSAWIFPRAVTVVLIAITAILSIDALLKGRSEFLWRSGQLLRDVGVFSGGIIGYALALQRLGFWLSSLIMFVGCSYLLSPRRDVRALAWAVASGVVVCSLALVVFGEFLRVRLPSGAWLQAVRS